MMWAFIAFLALWPGVLLAGLGWSVLHLERALLSPKGREAIQ